MMNPQIPKKQRVINLSIWTIIFVLLGYFMNSYFYREGSSVMLSLIYSFLGTVFLIGLIISWVNLLKK